jgi:hypothetical protein
VYPSEAHVCLNYINQYTVEVADWVAQQLLVQARPAPAAVH